MPVAFSTLGQESSFLESLVRYYLDICFTDSKILFSLPLLILSVLVGVFLKKEKKTSGFVFFFTLVEFSGKQSQRMCSVAI